MKPLHRRWLRCFILAALALPCSLVFFLGASEAQIRGPIRPPMRPPFGPNPNINNPLNPPNNPLNPPNNPLNPNNGPNGPLGIQKIWKCSRCGASLGTGTLPVDKCPSCGARIINGAPQGGGPNMGNTPPVNNPLAPPNQPPVNNPITPPQRTAR